ncbi:MAG: hypothetical protein QOK63_09815 [Nitrososphaeraceae archaeon]|nr:hypothetical protein [Nitrososphaeraceae archaeon]
MHRKSRVEIVDFSEKEDEKISYCKECLKFGFSVPLKNRMYPNNEPMPVDHENWLQCHECGEIVPIYEIEKESSIRDVVETVDNPFDIGTSFLGIDSRSVGGKKARKKKERQRQLDDINDPDVKRELASGQIRLISYKES